MELVFSFPTAETPGFLRRQKAAVALQNELANPKAETLDKMVEFLMQFVKEPEGEAARELIWAMSQTDFEAVLKKVTESQAAPKS